MWFDSDEGDESFQPDELRLLQLVRARCEEGLLDVDPDDTFAIPALGDHRRELLLLLFVDDDQAATSLLVFGVFCASDAAVADEVHDQMFTLPGAPTEAAAGFRGTPDELTWQVVDWFVRRSRTPVARREWDKDGRTVVRQWFLPRTGRNLTTVPQWLTEEPTRVVHVRGDL